MFSWGSRRKFLYIASTAFFVLFIIVAISIVTFYERPNCSDGKKNGDEIGVDCGGSCNSVCQSAVSPVLTDWARAFKIRDKYYSVAIYLENRNTFFEARNAAYQFKVYDVNNLLLYDKKGNAFIPAGQAFGILEGGLYFGDRIPSRVTFEWQGSPNWEKTSSKDMVMTGEVTRVVDDSGLTTISASVSNQGLQPVYNIFGFVIAYDSKGDAIAASKTVVDKIDSGGQGKMVFFWPEPFNSSINRVEILHWIVP